MQGGDARTINKPFLYSLTLKRKLTAIPKLVEFRKMT